MKTLEQKTLEQDMNHDIKEVMPEQNFDTADGRRVWGRWLGWGMAAALILTVGWLGWRWQSARNTQASEIKTVRVTRATLRRRISATGVVSVQTGGLVKIGSQVSGRIKRLYADVGSYVHAGQVIAELDLPDIDAQLQQAQENLAQATTRWEQQRTGVGLQHAEVISGVRQADETVREASAQLATASISARVQPLQTRAAIRQAQAGLVSARKKLQQNEVTTPSQIASAEASVHKAQAAYENAQASLHRQEVLYQRGFVAAADLDNTHMAAASTEAELTAAKQDLETLRQNLAAQREVAQQEVAQAEAALATAQAAQERDAQLEQAVRQMRAQLASARTQRVLAQAQGVQDVLKQQDLQAARQALDQAHAQVRYYEVLRSRTFIRAPITGTVLQLAAQQGETVAAGLSAPTLVVVADLKRLQVDAYVDETDIGRVRVRQPVEVTVDAFPDRVFHGKVVRIASGSTLQQGVVTYDVTVAIRDANDQLKPDMTASVEIIAEEHPNTLVLPIAAVKHGANGAYVYRLSRHGVKRHKVKVGITEGSSVEIVSGLKEGNTVVLSGYEDKARDKPATNAPTTGLPLGFPHR